jgi:hypothetical protein
LKVKRFSTEAKSPGRETVRGFLLVRASVALSGLFRNNDHLRYRKTDRPTAAAVVASMAQHSDGLLHKQNIQTV